MPRRGMTVRIRLIHDRCSRLFQATAVWAALAMVAAGQPPERSEEPAENGGAPVEEIRTTPANEGTVTEAGPEIYYLRDDAGGLVPVPGFRYRDFIDLMRLKEGLPGQPEPPAAVLETVEISATLPDPSTAAAAEERSCPAEVRFTVRQVRAGWVSVPIDLHGFFVASAPVHEGPGEMVLSVDAADPKRDTVRFWFNARPEGADVRHTVTVQAGVAVESSSLSDTVTLSVPTATASRVELRTSRSDPSVTVRPASIPPLVGPLRNEDGSTAGSVVSVVGAAGPVQVRISDRGTEVAPIGAVPEAMVESLVRVDGRTAFIQATLRLDNLPLRMETLSIALPPRATLRRVREPAMLVQRTGTPEKPVAVVRVDRDHEGRAVVELECEQAIDASGRTAFDPMGFAIADFPDWRQRGRVSLCVDGEWQIEWSDAGANRRIDPTIAARRPGFVAAFAHDAQPASLPLRVRARGSRVVVEPEYRYDVGATRITLDARLRVGVRGAAVSRFVVGLDGWEVDEVGPIGLVDAAGVTSEAGRIVIPFQQGLAGDAVIDIRCSRPIDRGADTVVWKFPVPEASLIGPAAVLVASASDIELVPDATGMRGLVRQVSPAPLRSDVDRLALAYRLDGNDGVFAAQRRFLERRIDASIRAQVDIGESRMSVAETIRFAVAHVPLEFVELLVPETILRSGGLEIRQGGQLLNPVAEPVAAGTVAAAIPEESVPNVDDQAAESSPSDTADDRHRGGADAPDVRRVKVRVMLPVPLLGAGEVSVTYQWPTPGVPAEATVADDLPLVVPVEAKVGRQSLQIGVVDALSVDVRGEDWKRDAAAPASRAWVAPRLLDHVPLALAARRQEIVGETIVEAAWLQTRLLAERREDTFVYAISTAADRVSVTLPSDVVARAAADSDLSIEVRLDGHRLDSPVRSDGRVSVDVKAGGGRTAALLEIDISRPRWAADAKTVSGLERIVLEAPAFPEGMQQRRFYWELHLPADQHVLVPPSGWTGQQRWQWGTFGMERQPLVSQDVLLDWVRDAAGMDRQSVRGAVDTGFVSRRAVYSSVGPPGVGVVWAAATWLLVLVVSGLILAMGLTFLYVPAIRTVPTVIGLAMLVTIGAAVAPDMAPMAVQSGLPGAALVALAAVMRGLLRPARPQMSQFVRGGSSLTRLVPPPSIIVTPSALRPAESVTTTGRSAS